MQNGVIPRGTLVGDSGFRLEARLMTPFINPNNEQEERYNRAHRSTRCVIERCNGVLKSRFRCLDVSGGTLRLNPIDAANVIIACCSLHNRAIINKIPFPDDLLLPQNNIVDNVINDYADNGRRRRLNIVQNIV